MLAFRTVQVGGPYNVTITKRRKPKRCATLLINGVLQCNLLEPFRKCILVYIYTYLVYTHSLESPLSWETDVVECRRVTAGDRGWSRVGLLYC